MAPETPPKPEITSGSNLQATEWLAAGFLVLSIVMLYFKLPHSDELFLMSMAALFRGMNSK